MEGSKGRWLLSRAPRASRLIDARDPQKVKLKFSSSRRRPVPFGSVCCVLDHNTDGTRLLICPQR
jgi:hypothetical protein